MSKYSSERREINNYKTFIRKLRILKEGVTSEKIPVKQINSYK